MEREIGTGRRSVIDMAAAGGGPTTAEDFNRNGAEVAPSGRRGALGMYDEKNNRCVGPWSRIGSLGIALSGSPLSSFL